MHDGYFTYSVASTTLLSDAVITAETQHDACL